MEEEAMKEQNCVEAGTLGEVCYAISTVVTVGGDPDEVARRHAKRLKDNLATVAPNRTN